MTPAPQKIRSWINRQRTLGTPSPSYLAWLRSQYRVRCDITVIPAVSVEKTPEYQVVNKYNTQKENSSGQTIDQ